jgi:transglutaminase/protease-like cytokinesis protein 3
MEPQWQLIPVPISQKAFALQPIYSPLYFSLNLHLERPQSGILKSKGEKYYEFTFTTPEKNLDFGYAYDGDRYLHSLTPSYQKGMAVLKIPVQQRPLNLLVGVQMVVRFQSN